MRIAAVTMVHKGYRTLKRWYEHYGDLVGYSNLYIVSHGDDPKHRDIAPRANVIGIPHTALERFDRQRHRALDGLSTFLNTYLDVVLRVDIDEFVFVDPEVHPDLPTCLRSVEADAWFCTGFNLYSTPHDAPLDYDRPFSEQRKLAVISSLYSKAVAGRNGMLIGFHGAKDPSNENPSRMALPRGLYLAHVRHAEAGTRTAFDSWSDQSRARDNARQNLRDGTWANDLPIVEAEAQLDKGFDLLSAGFERNRKKRPKIWMVPRIKPDAAFHIPERFVGRF